MAKLRVGGNGTAPGSSLWMWCPGCDDAHRVTIGTTGSWTWDGNETAPTISPSILVTGAQWKVGDAFYKPLHVKATETGAQTVCHSFLVAGVWQFLGDCTHALAGQHVPMVDWLTDEHFD